MLLKVPLKFIAIAFFYTGLSFYPVTTMQGNSLPTISLKSVKQQNNKIKVALPFDAEVFLKNETSLSGRLINVDSSQETITLSLSGESREVEVRDIEKVKFAREFKLIHSGRIVIRGNQSSSNIVEIWSESLANFRIINPQNGLAEITLNSVSKNKLRGILSVAKKSSYVVDEIIFDTSTQKITIKATPYSE